jgi:hypothetical protein
LEELEFTQGKKNWGSSFCSGLREVERGDFLTIGNAMKADLSRFSAALAYPVCSAKTITT